MFVRTHRSLPLPIVRPTLSWGVRFESCLPTHIRSADLAVGRNAIWGRRPADLAEWLGRSSALVKSRRHPIRGSGRKLCECGHRPLASDAAGDRRKMTFVTKRIQVRLCTKFKWRKSRPRPLRSAVFMRLAYSSHSEQSASTMVLDKRGWPITIPNKSCRSAGPTPGGGKRRQSLRAETLSR